MVREEVETWIFRERIRKRAWGLEKRLKNKRREVVRKCMEEMRERRKRRKIIGRLEQKKKEVCRERSMSGGKRRRNEM